MIFIGINTYHISENSLSTFIYIYIKMYIQYIYTKFKGTLNWAKRGRSGYYAACTFVGMKQCIVSIYGHDSLGIFTPRLA